MLNSFIKVKDLRIKNAMIHGTSNMYTAFEQFMDKVNLSNKSYVIILSDCRDWAGPRVDGVQSSRDLIEEMVESILNHDDHHRFQSETILYEIDQRKFVFTVYFVLSVFDSLGVDCSCVTIW